MAGKERAHSKQYPELNRFASPDEAKASLKAWQKQLMKSPKFWFALLGYACGMGVIMAAIIVSLRTWLQLPKSVFGGVVGGLTGGPAVVVIALFWRKQCRQFLREKLVEKGIPICIKCGYDLQGQTEPRCSECGTAFDAKLITPPKGSQRPASR